jgi:hypothetical protein
MKGIKMADDNTTPASDPSTAQTPVQPLKAVTPPEDAPTLTQKQVDAIMGNTRKEASTAALAAMAKKLGFESVEEMETAASEAKALKEKSKTDLEKETERANKAEAKAAAAEAKALEAEATRRADYVDSRMTAIATAAKAVDATEVAEYLRSKRADDVDALYSEDGKFNDEKAKKLIEDLKKSKEHWFAKASGVGSPSVSNGRPLQPDADMNKRATEQLRRQIRNS